MPPIPLPGSLETTVSAEHEVQEEHLEEHEASGQLSNNPATTNKVMLESGQTEEERRLLRKKQRLLNRELEAPDASGKRLQKLRETNNLLFQEVKFTREAVLDADNVQAFSHKVAHEVQKYIKVPRYDAFRLQQKLVQKCQSSSRGVTFFDWRTLGRQSGLCFNAVPSHCTFLSGPLDDPTKKTIVRAARRRRSQEREDVEEEEPEEVRNQQDDSVNHMPEVERNLKKLWKTLRQRCKLQQDANEQRIEELKQEFPDREKDMKENLKRHGAEIDAIRFLFNPRSFTQTVENIFHFSFLVKKGDVGISLNKQCNNDLVDALPGPVIRPTKSSSRCSTPEVAKPKQAIIKLTMRDFRRLCEAYNVEEGDLPHRSSSRDPT